MNNIKIGWLCSYTPEEIITAAGLKPVRMLGNGLPIQDADTFLHSNLCPYVRNILDMGLQGEWNDLQGVVFVNSCDAMRRLSDAYRKYVKPGYHHLIDLPKINDDLAIDYFARSLKSFASSLEREFNVRIEDENLLESIKILNKTRRLIRELYLLRVNNDCHISSAELFHKTVHFLSEPKTDSLNYEISQFRHELERSTVKRNHSKLSADKRPNILVTGCIISQPELIELVEEAGGYVPVEDLCTSLRHFEGCVKEEGDPYSSLAERYLKRVPCARMQNIRLKLKYLLSLIHDFHIDGVIYYTIKFCDQFLYDFPLLKIELEKFNIPSLHLQGDYSLGSLGQMLTRLAAFIELLNERKPEQRL